MSDAPLPEPRDAAAPVRLRLDAAPGRGRDTTRYDGQDDFLGGDTGGSRLDSVRLREYVRTVYKRRWIAISAFVVVVTGAALHSLSQVPVYQARVRLLFEPERATIAGFRGLVEIDVTSSTYFHTQYAVLQSRRFARRAMEALDIWKPAAQQAAPSMPEPAPAPPPQRGAIASVLTSIGDALRTVRAGIGPGAGDVGPPRVDETVAQAARIDAFLAGLSVVPVVNSRVMEILYTSSDPVAAAKYANAVAAAYIDQNLEFKFLASKEAAEWLAARLSEQRARVEASEQALQRYRERNQVVAIDASASGSLQRLADVTAAMTRAKTERIAKEALHNQLQAVRSDRAALDTFPAILANPYVQELKSQLANLARQQVQLAEKLGEKHPDLIKARKAVETADARLQMEISKVIESVRNDFFAARATESSLVQVYESQRREALELNRSGVELAVLQRDAESNRQIYDSLMQRAKESDITGEIKRNNVRILDVAEVPRAPVRPTGMGDLRYGALAGVTVALVFVWFFEYIDNRIKSPLDIHRYLGLAFLGIVPKIPSGPANTESPLVNNGVPFPFAEAFRALRTNVLFSAAPDGLRSLVVTSADKGDGKTLIASNLAICLAQAGQRVLLIDADLRRPRVHDVFGITQEPGLSNLIVGNAAAAEAIRQPPIQGLWLLPSGRIPPNPAELLGSKRFVEFLHKLDGHFDWVIVDSPPAMPVTDPSVVAHHTWATLFVVSSERTSRYGAREAVDHLDAAGGRILGAVLNQVDLKGNPYYYARKYSRRYRAYETGLTKIS